MGLEIVPIDTRKDDIEQPILAEATVIPRLTSNVLFVGASGSGKSTLLANLLTRSEFMEGWFDRTLLVSPTARTDDIQKLISDALEDQDIVDDLKEAPEIIGELMDEQREKIEKEGADKAPQICLIYDDVVADRDLMKSDVFSRSFIMSRHFNFTTFLCTQSFTAAPRRARLQCQNLFYYKGSNSEAELLAEEFSPPGFNKKQMLRLIAFATDEQYSFLHVNRRATFDTRYRRNLDQVIDLTTVPI